MGKRKKSKDRESEDYIRNKIRKLHEKLSRKRSSTQQNSPSQQQRMQPSIPPVSPPEESSRHQPTSPSKESPPTPLQDLDSRDLEQNAEASDGELPEEFLIALGTEGQEQSEVGAPIRTELAMRWKKLMNDGLGKEPREAIIKKYPTPSNFSAAVAPIVNAEILSSLSEPSIKRDKRIVIRQNLTGCLMTCLGRCLTNILKGNINSTSIIEEINDAAKLAAEIHHQDSASRRFFCLAGASKNIQDAVRQQPIDKFLFGEDCGDRIKAAQSIQKTSNSIKNAEKKKQPENNKPKQGNWKGPPQYNQHQLHRARGGQQHRPPPRKHYNQPHRKERQTTYKPKSRYHR